MLDFVELDEVDPIGLVVGAELTALLGACFGLCLLWLGLRLLVEVDYLLADTLKFVGGCLLLLA